MSQLRIPGTRSFPRKKRRSRLTPAISHVSTWLAIILVSLGIASVTQSQSAATTAAEQTSPAPAQLPATAPTGDSRCATCHPAEVAGYARSAMAHSLRRPGQEPDGIVTAHGSKITMYSTPTGYWQRWENGGDRSEYHIDWVVGSGNHASGYLVDIGGHLFQSPIAYFKSRQSYDLAPGFENQPDPDFTRPIREECVLCHSGNVLEVTGTLNEYRAPVFPASEEAITCDRCHGPAAKHLADPRAGNIVNPANLEPAARAMPSLRSRPCPQSRKKSQRLRARPTRRRCIHDLS